MASITIALDWAANPNHSGLLLAQARGYFAAEGVEARILPAERDRSVVDLVRAGAADFAYAFAGTVIDQRAKGVPLVSVAAVGQRHHSSLVALKASGITRPADLAGRRYASFGHPALERAVISAMMAHDGATDPMFDLRVTRFASVAGLQAGEYDFLWVYDAIEGMEARAAGIELVSFAPGDYGIPNYNAPVIFAADALLTDASRADAARRALAALRRGYAEAVADPDGTAGEIVSAGASLGGWLFTDPRATELSLRDLSREWRNDVASWGIHRLEDWRGFARFLWQHNALGEIPEPDCASYFTNALLG